MHRNLALILATTICSVPALMAGTVDAQSTAKPEAVKSTSEKSDGMPVYKGTGSESHHPRVRLGGIMIGASYSHGFPYYPYGYYGPYGGFYDPFWGIYSPFWYSPYAYPGFYNGFAYGPGMGEVKLPTKSRSASVYIDGAYAGTADKLKHVWLEPGVYSFEVKDGRQLQVKQKVYVLSGKTVQLHPGESRDQVNE